MAVTRLENLLKSGNSSRLGKIIQTAQSMQVLTDALRRDLPAELGREIESVSLRDGRLTVLTSSQAFASRLRFEAEALLAAARAAGADATACDVRVRR